MSQDANTYGIVYTPPQAPPELSVQTVRDLKARLTLHGIRYVRITWVDFSNTVRFRVLPVSYFRKLLDTSRPGVCLAKVTLGIVGILLAEGFLGTGEDLYVIDVSTFRVCAYAPGHASVMGCFQEKLPSPTAGPTIDFCPRTLVKRIADEAYAKAGLSFLVGFESEFIILSETSPKPIAVNNADWSCAAKLFSGSKETVILEEIADTLQAGGIELQMYHAEAAPGQFEVVTGPLPPLEAADALVFTRQTIYNVTNKHGYRATFAPRLHKDNCGSAAHMHLSVHSSRPSPASRADASRAPTLSPTERSFLQSLLTHLPAVCALTLPTRASYARMVDGIWAGGTYAAWGTDNREAPVRLCGPPGHHHFELKCVDGTSTPHIAIAGVIAAGVRGVLDGALLATGDCKIPVALMDEAQRREVGQENPGRLPRILEDAREFLAGDEVLREGLGADFVEKYLAVNKVLDQFLKEDTEDAAIVRLVEYY
ncbi:FLU1-II protein [Obba rivulosa]|uniref:Glutamine synthetase n=1 Tax=Obba rivulosa TaxID=1052685 RepID=A0A8E2DH15_9APHY|nr:FLU1-II protein [Obba rivulosa]